jgi:3-oxoadipate enol-lactonase
MTNWKTELVLPPPRIAVDHIGSGSLVICLHGVGGNRTNWHDQLPAFSSHFHAAAWDARGYGESDDYEGPLDFADFSRDLLRVLDFFAAQRAHLVGLSMGGQIAMDFCLSYPERVATLTICDSMPGRGSLSPEQASEFIRLRQEPLLAGKTPADIAPAVARSLVSPSARLGSYERLVASMSTLHKESYLKTIAAATRAHALDLEEIRVPTHVIVGEDDTLTPPAMARQITARILGARFTQIARAGHLSNIEQPEAFNAAALSFLLEYRDRR